MRSGFFVVFITVPDRKVAEKIARGVVGDRLAACVNIIPGVRSLYRWKGKVESATECLLIAKTRRSRLPALEKRVKKLHPYDVPEIIALPIASGSASYLEWLREET